MNTKYLRNKNLALLGLGAENEALLDFLIKNKIECNVSIFDSRDSSLLGVKYTKYKNNNNIYWNLAKKKNNLRDFDVLFRSPGWPAFEDGIVEAKKENKNITLSSPMNLFFELCPTRNIIGVTGTKGKGTTSSLIYEIIKKSGRRVFLGGNIGIAPFSFIDKIKKNYFVVLELSSFQLEDLEHSPLISVFTNFYREHLSSSDPNNPNYHKSLNAYWLAKKNIFKYQDKNGKLVINSKLAKKMEKEKVASKVIYFSKADLKSKLIGEHNKENIDAALETAKLLRIKKTVVDDAVKNFQGLEHRLEFVRQVRGVDYYNDSFATTPESTITALKSFQKPILSLMGGADKGSSFKSLALEVKKKVKYVILFKGPGSVKIKKELINLKYKKSNIKIVSSMPEAFLHAKKIAEPGDVVLLSTACASFGVFKNYKERGILFKKEVEKL